MDNAPPLPAGDAELQFDPVDLEIRWSRLISIMNEVDAAVARTSFSTIVGESRDFGVVLLDRKGRSLAQSQLSTPAFTITLPRTCKLLLEEFPPETLEPGDALITNDPWMGTGHLPDFTICTPVFHKERLVAFMGSVAHISDIGGRSDYLDDRDLFEEGLQIPPSRILRRGEPVRQLFRIIEANVRVPRLVIGDVHALLGAQRLGGRRLKEFFEDYVEDSLDDLAGDILTRSEAAMAAAVGRLPDGVYRYALDADGHRQPIRVAATVTVSGSRVKVDLTGSSMEQESSSVNCPMSTTFCDCYYPFKCSLVPGLPNNEGLFRFLEVTAPEGCLYNARFPRAVRARSKSSFHLHMAIYGALSGALGLHVQAGSGSFWSLVATGSGPDGGAYRAHMLPNGGKGATADGDGASTIAFPYNGTITPAEIFENNAPVRIRCREFIPNSGGSGQFRGGLGQRIAFTPASSSPVTFFVRPDKLHHPAPGLAGGSSGRPGRLLLNEREAPLAPTTLGPEDTLTLELPGGAGFGDAGKRDPASTAHDLELGYTTRDPEFACGA